MKGALQPDHIPVNKYQLKMLGMVPLTPVEISGIEDELEITELPDRTTASGGNRKATEFDITIPAHHIIEQAAMELWFRQSQDPVVPSYKRTGTLIMQRISGKGDRSYTVMGVYPFKRALPDLDMSNEGEMASVVWSLKVDDVIPI